MALTSPSSCSTPRLDLSPLWISRSFDDPSEPSNIVSLLLPNGKTPLEPCRFGLDQPGRLRIFSFAYEHKSLHISTFASTSAALTARHI